VGELEIKQKKFVRLIGKLIEFAYASGYELTFGDAYRDPRCPYGSEVSLHKSRLAIDLNLFKDGQFCRESEDHEPLGKFWKALDPECEWGGEGKRYDGNHYSMSYKGRW
jgi:hypothetical protein